MVQVPDQLLGRVGTPLNTLSTHHQNRLAQATLMLLIFSHFVTFIILAHDKSSGAPTGVAFTLVRHGENTGGGSGSMQSIPGLFSQNNKGTGTVNSVGQAAEQATQSVMLLTLAVYVIQSSQVFGGLNVCLAMVAVTSVALARVTLWFGLNARCSLTFIMPIVSAPA